MDNGQDLSQAVEVSNYVREILHFGVVICIGEVGTISNTGNLLVTRLALIK